MFITEFSGSILTDQSQDTKELSLVIVTPFIRRGQKYLVRFINSCWRVSNDIYWSYRVRDENEWCERWMMSRGHNGAVSDWSGHHCYKISQADGSGLLAGWLGSITPHDYGQLAGSWLGKYSHRNIKIFKYSNSASVNMGMYDVPFTMPLSMGV